MTADKRAKALGKSTPGPRYVRAQAGGYLVYAADSCSVGWHSPTISSGRSITSDEARANAHLDAAAPKMAEALIYARRKLANCAKAHGNDAETIEALCGPIDEALAKARGEQS